VAQGNFLLYLDLHGHSRQKGVFAYGCIQDDSPPYTAAPPPVAAPSVATNVPARSSRHTVAAGGGKSGTDNKLAFGRRQRAGDAPGGASGLRAKGSRPSSYRSPSPNSDPAPAMPGKGGAQTGRGRAQDLPLSHMVTGDSNLLVPPPRAVGGSRAERERRVRWGSCSSHCKEVGIRQYCLALDNCLVCLCVCAVV
jgi:hypothetical protein